MTGQEAYDLYGAVAFKHITERGGKLVTFNKMELQVIGSDKGWHRLVTMEYQSADAWLEMIDDPDYLQSLVHRDAGLEATEVFVTRPKLEA